MTNKLFYGDNLDVLREHIASESVDLVYLDPPFNSNASYNILFKSPKGAAADSKIEAFETIGTTGDEAHDAFHGVMTSGNTDVANNAADLSAPSGFTLAELFQGRRPKVLLRIGRLRQARAEGRDSGTEDVAMTITLPKEDTLLLPTLRVIDELGGSASVEEIREALVERMGLSQEQLEVRHEKSGAVVLVHRMAFVRTYLRIAGMLASGGRGLWVLTDKGRQALLGTEDALKAEVRKLFAAYNAVRRAEAASAIEEGDSGETEASGEEAEWTDQLLATLRTMDPSAFERLAQRLLRESGFVKVEVTGKSGDGGIDGSGVLRMNLISFQVLFQCKRYVGSVPAGTVRDFRGAMQGRADKGLIITTGTFTADARKEATRDGAPAIDLIDGEALCQLLKERHLGVRVREVVREEVAVVPEFFAEI